MKNILQRLLVLCCVAALPVTSVKASKSSPSAPAEPSHMSKEARATLTSHDGHTYSEIIIDRTSIDKELEKHGKELDYIIDMSLHRGLDACTSCLRSRVTTVRLNELKEKLIIELRLMVIDNGGLLSSKKHKYQTIRTVRPLPTKETNGKPLRIVLNYNHEQNCIMAK